MKKLGFLFLATVTMGLGGCAGKKGPEPTKPIRLAVIPKGTTHEFWKTHSRGRVKAARELWRAGTQVIEVIWKGPLREGRPRAADPGRRGLHEPGRQRHRARAARRQGARPARGGGRQKQVIPTVIIDSALESEQIVSFVATDNLKGGALAADRLGELLAGKGKVLLLRYQEGSASTEPARAGLPREMKEPMPRHRGDLLRPVCGTDPRHRQARLREPAQPIRRRAARHLHRQRIVDGGHAPRASGHREGWQDLLPRVRLAPALFIDAMRPSSSAASSSRIHSDGLPRGEDDGRSSRRASRSRSGSTPASDSSRRRTSTRPDVQALLHPPDRASTFTERGSGGRAPNLISPSGSRALPSASVPTVALDGVSLDRAAAVGCTRSSARTAPARARCSNVLAGSLQPDGGSDARPRDAATRRASPREARARGHRPDPSGAVALSSPHGRRERSHRAEPARAGLARSHGKSRAGRPRRPRGVRAPGHRPAIAVGALPIAARQVVEICRAMAAEPRIVLMDEPTSSLQREDVAATVRVYPSPRAIRRVRRLHQPLPRRGS